MQHIPRDACTQLTSPHTRIPRQCSLMPMPWQLSSWGRTARGGLHHLVSEAACQKLTHQQGWSDSRHLLGNATPPRNQEQGSQNKTTLANQGLSASNSSPAPRWLSWLGTCRLLPGERSCKAICSVLPPPVPHKALSQLHTGRKTRTDLTIVDTHKPRTRGSESRLWAEAPAPCPTKALQELQEPRSPPRLGADVCSWQKSGVFSITSLLLWFCGTAKISLSISKLFLKRSVIPKS